jgi:hypothetical protein
MHYGVVKQRNSVEDRDRFCTATSWKTEKIGHKDFVTLKWEAVNE